MLSDESIQKLIDFEQELVDTIINSSALMRLAVRKNTITGVMLRIAVSRIMQFLAHRDLEPIMMLAKNFYQNDDFNR